MRPESCLAYTSGTPRIGFGSSTPSLIRRSRPARSVTSILPSGRKARPHGWDKPLVRMTTRILCCSAVSRMNGPVPSGSRGTVGAFRCWANPAVITSNKRTPCRRFCIDHLLRHILGKPPIEVNIDAFYPRHQLRRHVRPLRARELPFVPHFGHRIAGGNSAVFSSELFERKAFQPISRSAEGLESLVSPLKSPKGLVDLLVPPWTAPTRLVEPR